MVVQLIVEAEPDQSHVCTAVRKRVPIRSRYLHDPHTSSLMSFTGMPKAIRYSLNQD